MREQYHSFGELESACGSSAPTSTPASTALLGGGPSSGLAEELQRLHPLPKSPFTAVFALPGG